MSVDLLRDGHAAVEYHSGSGIDRLLSPRPFLTATTPSGVAVTDVEPDDHLHHLGLSAALPDVNGTSFWGGRTYVRGQGSTMLANHGVQRAVSRDIDAGSVVENIDWLDPHGDLVLSEVRTITARVSGAAWDVTWTSHLTALDGPVTLGSPQTNGRDGAFYGGLFWRAPFAAAAVSTADGDGVDAAHGSRSPWLCVSTDAATLVAATGNSMPWFVRAEGYVGFGPAIAVDERREVPPGETLRLDLAVAIMDAAPASVPDVVSRLRDGVRDRV